MAADDRLYKKSKYRGERDQYFEALHRHNLPREEVTFAELLTEAGYATGFFGKWHCGAHEDYRPDKRGFQVAKGYRTEHVGTGTSRHWGKTFKKYAANMHDIPDDGYVSDLLTDQCIEFMCQNKQKPFLAVLSHYLLHTPIQPKPEKQVKYEKRPKTDQCHPGYAAMVESVDESVGRVMGALKKLGLDENTLVVFTSDNGGLTPKYTSNYPLMGGKSFPFEAGTKVPLLIRWPKVIKPGVSKQRVIAMDFYPTFLEVAGLPLRPDQHADGVSLMPILRRTGSLPARPLVFHYPHYTHATGPYSSIIQNDWKLIRFYNNEAGTYLLYNLREDPTEQNNLSDSEPEKLRYLAKQLDKLLTEMDAEMPIKNPHFDPDFQGVKNRKFTNDLAMKERRLFEKRLKQKSPVKQPGANQLNR